VPNLTDVAAISAGYFSLALKSNRTVVAWGDNSSGQTQVPGGFTNIAAISAGGFHGLILKSDGTVVNWGGNNHGQLNQPPGLTNVVAISAGANHSLALRSDGTVAAWGWSQYGQMNMPPGLSGIAAVAAGWGHNLALRSNGTVVAWGYNAYGQINVPPSLSNVVAIAAGYQHSLALKADGTVAAWGYDQGGQSTLPAGLANVLTIEGGGFHSLAITRGPGVAIQPQSRLVFPGEKAGFNVSPTGSLPLHFQWQFNGTNVEGATNISHLVTNVQQADLGDYRVVVSNGYGIVTSLVARLEFHRPPSIVTNPESQTVRELENVTFAIAVAGTDPLWYQWRLNGTDISGATNSSLTLSAVHTNQAGLYSVIVSNAAGAGASADALLRVSPTYIIDNLAATAVGDWTSGWVRAPMYGTNYLFKTQGTGDSYVHFAPDLAEPGSYQVLEFHPVAANHTTNATYVVSFDGGSETVLVNQKTNRGTWNLLGIYPFAAGTGGHVRITDTFPDAVQIVGADAVMFVKVLPPLLVAQLADITVNEGETARFYVKTTATPPLTYTWRRGTNIISTGSTAFLELANARPEDAGAYNVVVANSAGFTTSASAGLTVRPRLKFTSASPSLVLHWPEGFVLQTSTNVTGPYGDVSNVLNAYTNATEDGSRFFRLKR
jgi:hypothetical protein